MTDNKKQRTLITRREFIQVLTALSASSPLSSFAATKILGEETADIYNNPSDPWLTIASVQEHLFPADKNSPGAQDIKALVFLRNMLDAPDTEQEEKNFILNGVTWLNDLANKHHSNNFVQLKTNDKETILRKIETSNAGSRWLSLMMTYLIEALLSDPVYGGNFQQKGWQWLEHIPGFPTPDINKVYFKLGANASSRRRTKA